ncbi:MAG: dihydroorotase [Proteobacteria bacterium]|nr:dihydroorotase [Pseudomonadota bacterium]
MSVAKPGRIAYINARVVDPASGFDGPGEVLTSGQEILDIGSKLFDGKVSADTQVVDCQGMCLAPGLVDMRVQLREPGEEHKESLKSAGEAAVAGGVTTMVCLPNTNPVVDDEPTLEFVARRARQLALTKVYCYGAVTKGLQGKELAEMGLLSKAGALAFTDATRAIADAQVMRRALQYAATFGLMIVQHPEEPTLAGGVMNAGEIATRMGLSGIPREAEIIMLERDIRLTAMTGGRYHAAHISTADSVEIIARAKKQGLNVTCDTAPFYFSLNELAVGDYKTFAKLSPPLRNEQDRQAIVAGLKSGVIDAIASDHAPHDQDSKRLPFPQAAFGGSGLETLLAVSLDLFHNGDMPLIEVIRRLTSGPAKLLGLEAGRLTRGQKADLVIFNPDESWKVIADAFKSKSKNSPFDGRPVQGRVLRTVIDGRAVYDVLGAAQAPARLTAAKA